MVPTLITCLIALGAISSIFCVGTATASVTLDKKLKGLEFVAYGCALGVFVHALIGLLIVATPFNKHYLAIFLLISANTASLYRHINLQLTQKNSEITSKDVALTMSFWVLFSFASIAITSLPIHFPDNLVDGPYVIKNHHLHVKIQTITGHLPADNYVPYLVSEFFLRDISFKDERPLMPGQEVSNRPILMALTAMPFRAMLDPPPRQDGGLGKFSYVGTEWPDIAKLGEDRYYSQFLAVGIALNAMLLIGAALLFRSFLLSRVTTCIGLLLIVTSPYFISQTLFIWPKALAGFFVLLSLHAIRFNKSVLLAAIFSALAYWSHPYAVVFAGSIALYLLIQRIRGFIPLRAFVAFCVCYVALLAPWFIWTQIFLKIPSDLVTQNLLTNAPLLDMVWVRIYNVYELLVPRFLEIFPFDGDRIVQNSLVCVPGIIGIFFWLQTYIGAGKYAKEEGFLVFYGLILPGILLAIVFSGPAVPALHGFQAIAPILIMFGLKWMSDNQSFRLLTLLLVAQLAINFAMLLIRAKTLGLFS